MIAWIQGTFVRGTPHAHRDPAPGRKNPPGLSGGSLGIGEYLETKAADRGIEGFVRKLQLSTIHRSELDIADSTSLGHPLGDGYHVLGQIDPGHVPGRPDIPGDRDRRLSRPGAQVQNPVVGNDCVVMGS